MFSIFDVIIALLLSFITAFISVKPVISLSKKLSVVDYPNYRKIHTKVMPRLGGLSIFFGVLAGLLYIQPTHPNIIPIYIGGLIILITGIIDDKYQITALMKLSGQLVATGILIYSGLIIERITLPFIGVVELGYLSAIVTLAWFIIVINAINLIDGLDGLATGVTTIALISILVMAIIDAQILVAYLCVLLIGSNLGFLIHNFHPAKIYMGDTGALFLGYCIAVISLLGLFKNVTLLGFIIPVIVLAVPLFDTVFAILRRIINKVPIMMPDKQHIHYQLINAGFSHRQTVLIIYAFSALFGILAIGFSNSSMALSLFLAFLILLLTHIFAEIVGVVFNGKMPVIKMVKKVFEKKNT